MIILWAVAQTVLVNLTGVAATPAIGSGSVVTGGEEIVTAAGVAANPAIGSGTVRISGVSLGIGEPVRLPRRKVKRDKFVVVGVHGSPRVGRMKVDVTTSLVSPDKRFVVMDAQFPFRTEFTFTLLGAPVPVVAIGGASFNIVTDLTEEEMLALMDIS